MATDGTTGWSALADVSIKHAKESQAYPKKLARSLLRALRKISSDKGIPTTGDELPAPRCGMQCSWWAWMGEGHRCQELCRRAKHHRGRCSCLLHDDDDPWAALLHTDDQQNRLHTHIIAAKKEHDIFTAPQHGFRRRGRRGADCGSVRAPGQVAVAVVVAAACPPTVAAAAVAVAGVVAAACPPTMRAAVAAAGAARRLVPRDIRTCVYETDSSDVRGCGAIYIYIYVYMYM